MNINEALDKIKNAVYGKDVRQAIHDGIETAYNLSNQVNMAKLYSNVHKVDITYDWAGRKVTFFSPGDFSTLVITNKFTANLPRGTSVVTSEYDSIVIWYNRISKTFFTTTLPDSYKHIQVDGDCCLGYVNFISKYSLISVDDEMSTTLPGVEPAALYSSNEKVVIDYDWVNKSITFDVKDQFGVLVQTKDWSSNLPVGKNVLTSTESSTTLWWNRVSKVFFTMSLSASYEYIQKYDDCYLGYVHFGQKYTTISIDNSIDANMSEIHPTGHYGGLSLPFVDFSRNKVVIPRNLYLIKGSKNIKFKDVTTEVELPFISTDGVVPTWMCLWYNSYLEKFFLSDVKYYTNMRNEPNVNYLGYIHTTAKVFIMNGKYQTCKTNNASVIGTSISTYKGLIPEGNVPNGNYDPAYRPAYRTWWYGITHNLFSMLVNDSWGGRRVTKTRSDDNASWALHRVASLEKDGVKPDVVFVEIGMNDLLGNVDIGPYAGVIDPNDDLTFANCYARLLDGIQTAYPETRIYCLTIPFAGGKTYKDHKKYNDAIKMVAEQYYATVIDVTNLGINESNCLKYTFDKVHPNDAGMNLIAGRVYNTVRENTLE